MITLLTGRKGSGKTKKLIDLAHDAADKSKGSVVAIEKGDTLTHAIAHSVRLINIAGYGIRDFTAFYGFIAGLLSGNYDITDVLIDSTLKIGGDSLELFARFIAKVSTLAEKNNVNFTFSVSANADEIPAGINDLVVKL